MDETNFRCWFTGNKCLQRLRFLLLFSAYKDTLTERSVRCDVIAIWAYWQIPKSLMVRCVLEVTACLTQESELPTWHFSTRYSRARPPLFLEAAQVNLQLLAVTPDTSRRSWTQRKIFQNPSQKYFTLQQNISASCPALKACAFAVSFMFQFTVQQMTGKFEKEDNIIIVGENCFEIS